MIRLNLIQLDLVTGIRILTCACMLGFAAWKDVKTREINDSVWIAFGVVGLALDAYQVASGDLILGDVAVPLITALVFGGVTGWLGLFGGADLLAFAAIAVIQPKSTLPLLYPAGFTPLIMVLSIITNSLLFGAFAAVYTLIQNLISGGSGILEGVTEPSWAKTILIFTGRRIKVEEVRGPPFHYPLEAFDDAVTKSTHIVLKPGIMDDAEAIKVFGRIKKSGKLHTWVTVTLPFIFCLFLGFITTLLVGDVILYVTSLLFT